MFAIFVANLNLSTHQSGRKVFVLAEIEMGGGLVMIKIENVNKTFVVKNGKSKHYKIFTSIR